MSLSLIRLAIVIPVSLSLCSAPLRSAHAQRASGEQESLIQLRAPVQGEPHAITLKEIVERRRIREAHISPDGTAVAFTIEQAFLERNKRRLALFVVCADGTGQPIKLLEEQNISSLQWVPTGKYLTYLSSRSGLQQIWQIAATGGVPEQLFAHPTRVNRYEWSPDGRQVAFIAADVVEPNENRIENDARGVIFNRSVSNGLFGWIAKASSGSPPQPVKLWIYHVGQRRAEKLAQSILSWRADDRVGLTAIWSPDSRKIAVHISRPTKDAEISPLNQDIAVISLDTRRYAPLITWGGANSGIAWSPDSGSISFVSQGGTKDKVIQKRSSVFVKDINNGKLLALNLGKGYGKNIVNAGWSKDGKRIFLEMGVPPGGERTLYGLHLNGGGLNSLSRNDEYLSDFSFSDDQARAACVRQNPTMPPEIAVLDLKTGDLKTVTNLHPEFSNIRLSKASKLAVTNRYGVVPRCYLLKPLDYVPGTKYPLVVIFNHGAGQFMSDSLGNYAFQVFAANGHAVLAINAGQSEPYHFGNFKEASVSWAYDPLASIEQCVDRVVKREGIADPSRIGVMGWSYGNFVTNFAITHSNLFSAASAGDGGLFNAATYWAGGLELQKMYDGVMGGGPYRETLKNWTEISPSLNADRVRIPVLLETTETGIVGELEFHTAIQKQGGQSELVVYRNAIHEFNNGQPKQSFYSMQLNLDWFNFWLQRKEDPDPSKQEQYARWRAMREALKRKRRAATH